MDITCGASFEVSTVGGVSICVDLNECELGLDTCVEGTVCVNCNTLSTDCPAEGFSCNQCDEGFEDDGDGNCIDIDECITGTLCVDSNECTNTDGSYTCQCGTFYQSETCSIQHVGGIPHQVCESPTCVPTNPCDSGICSTNSTCTNLHPHFSCCDDQSVCECPIGFIIDESNQMGAGNNVCIELECLSGFERATNETLCVDIDECSKGTDGCDDFCVNCGTVDCNRFLCQPCEKGFEDDGTGSCVDINECDSSPCGSGTCENTNGTYTCDCNSGYISTLSTCVITGLGSNNFHPHEECTEGPFCIEINECESAPCDYTCIDGQNSFQCCNDATQECACPSGYILNSENYPADCVPIECDSGFELNDDGDTCVDRNECVDDRYDCGEQFCVNTVGGVRCDVCPDGYELDDEGLCTDIDECAQGLDQCGNHALSFTGFEACANFPGSYTCNCDHGYEFSSMQCEIETRNGLMPHEVCTYIPLCHDIDECAPGAGLCRFDYACDNIAPGFKCCNVFGTRCDQSGN